MSLETKFSQQRGSSIILATTRRNGREKVGCIILGRGENDLKVRSWLTTAAGVPGFVGFAVDRTSFWEPLIELREGKIKREDAVAAIADRYKEFVNVFEGAGGAAALGATTTK